MRIRKFTLLLTSLIVIGTVFLVGCVEQEQRNTDFMSSEIQLHSAIFMFSEEDDEREIGTSIGLKNRELLSAVSSPDEPAILVNGLPITNGTIAFQRAYQLLPSSRPLREEIVSIVRLKVAQSEAIRLGIQPSQDEIDAYLERELYDLKNESFGSGFFLGYIEGMGITIEEYMVTQEQLVYESFQRQGLWDSLWDSVETMRDNREKYIDDLVNRATIEILDPEIRELFQ